MLFQFLLDTIKALNMQPMASRLLLEYSEVEDDLPTSLRPIG